MQTNGDRKGDVGPGFSNRIGKEILLQMGGTKKKARGTPRLKREKKRSLCDLCCKTFQGGSPKRLFSERKSTKRRRSSSKGQAVFSPRSQIRDRAGSIRNESTAGKLLVTVKTARQILKKRRGGRGRGGETRIPKAGRKGC